MADAVAAKIDGKRISTGIQGLDAVISGGLLKGRTHLVSGGPGAGKSIFALQFVLSGLKSGSKCVYVAINEQPEDLVATAKLLGWNFDGACASKKLLFLDA